MIVDVLDMNSLLVKKETTIKINETPEAFESS